MKKKNLTEVNPSEIKNEGFKGMFARYLWSTDDGCKNFAMRVFEFEPGGYTSYHSHLEDHEFYFLEGEPAYVDADGNEIRLAPGDTIYCPPEEPHQIKNMGKTKMRMICVIPILGSGDGKMSTGYVRREKHKGE
jgi:quercetin dioxygenase-like cupin family protein